MNDIQHPACFAESTSSRGEGSAVNTLTLTPALWLPKPATRWIPQVTKSLRESWSPGEREAHIAISEIHLLVVATPAQCIDGRLSIGKTLETILPLPGGEGWGEGKRSCHQPDVST